MGQCFGVGLGIEEGTRRGQGDKEGSCDSEDPL